VGGLQRALRKRYAAGMRRHVHVLVACCLALAAAGGAAAQEGDETTAAADTPPAEAAVAVAPPLPIDVVIVRPSPEPPPRPPQTINLSLRDADLVEVLRSFAVLGGFNLIIDPAVQGKVTVELKDVRWELALAVILRTHGLAAEIDGTVVSLRPLPVASGR
jgi:type II secretory pathway component GspD/PulD (secretin)